MFLLLVYLMFLFGGIFLMLNGVEEAPLGYEDSDGFHLVNSREEYARLRVAVSLEHDV